MVTAAERRLRSEDGQGLVELIISLIFIAVAVAAVIALMTSGATALQRSGQKGTAVTLADKQLEVYRTLAYKYIRFSHSATFSSFYTGAHASDSSIPASTLCTSAEQVTPSCIVTDSTPGETTCSSGPACVAPVQNVTGPDGRLYEIDTYISYSQPPTPVGITTPPRKLKSVLVVVRDRNHSSESIVARSGSTFDRSTNATG